MKGGEIMFGHLLGMTQFAATSAAYNERAASGLSEVIKALDFSIILDNYLMVVPVGIGVWLAVMASKKGIGWLKSFVKGA